MIVEVIEEINESGDIDLLFGFDDNPKNLDFIVKNY